MADQDPANLEAQRAVIEIALQMQDFATAEEHAAEAFVQAPADPEVRALKATVDFRHPETRAAALGDGPRRGRRGPRHRRRRRWC